MSTDVQDISLSGEIRAVCISREEEQPRILTVVATVSDNNDISSSSTDCKYNESTNNNEPRIIEPRLTTGALETEAIRAAQQSVNHTKALKFGFVRDCFFCVRIFVLILSMFLLLLSVAYCLSQFIDVKLDIITECEPKTPESIWQNSYEAYLKNDRKMTAESQFGHTNKACMTTNTIEINTDDLWYSNKYTLQYKKGWNARSILFLLNCIFLVFVTLYGIFMLISDGYNVYKGELQKKANAYHVGIGVEDNINTNTNKGPQEKRKPSQCAAFYINYLKPQFAKIKTDETAWIILKFVNEIFEFVLQSQALLLYNGYHAFDPQRKNDVYLANKPQFIIAFAVILSFNLLGSGIIWLLYAFRSKSCHGLRFNRYIFFVDKFSDFLYTLFPFYMLFRDDYNKETRSIQILLGELRVDSALPFIATFFPLTFLSIQCLTMMQSARKHMIVNYYRRWKEMIALIVYKDDQDMIIKKLKDIHDIKSEESVNWIEKSSTKKDRFIRKSIIAFISACFIVYSCVVLSLSTNHIKRYESYCNSVSEDNFIINRELSHNLTLSQSERQLLLQYPELYLYNKCLYKVFPFVSENVCQCRVFVVDWSDVYTTESQRKEYFNLTHGEILLHALDDWYMLEKFHTLEKVAASQEILTIKASMYKSIHLKAFDFRDALIESIEDGISAWKELEYLALINTYYLSVLPHDFRFPSLQFLLLESNGFNQLSDAICDLPQLQVLQIDNQLGFDTLPHCISQLSQLKALWLDYSVLTAIPFSLLSAQNLVQFSVFKGNIDYWSLLDYNIDYMSVDINDSAAIDEWFEDNLDFHDLEATKYWFTLNPICDEIEYLPSKLQYFMNATCLNPCEMTSNASFSTTSVVLELCPPRYLGNGRCDEQCLIAQCKWDHGDCVQLCFAPDPLLSQCSYHQLTNNECDDECNNEYCSQYFYGSSFLLPTIHTNDVGQELQADLFHCTAAATNNTQNNTNTTCSSSVSIYVDANVPQTDYYNCLSEWIGDGICDDTCRTNECTDDSGDCDEGNGCKQGSLCDTLYLFWNLLFEPKPGEYKFNYSYSCSVMWTNAVLMFDVDPALNCSDTMQKYDYNQDQHMNFREFTPAALTFADTEIYKYQQQNCSQCIGMQYYNI